MPKLTGPLISAEAAGQLADALVFSSWRGRPTVKYSKKPKQPRTLPQRGMRAWLKFLAQTWPNVAAADQATWSPIASTENISAQNAYCKINTAQCRNDLPPSQVYPAPRDDLAAVMFSAVLTSGPRHITFKLQVNAIRDNWFVLIYAVTLADYALTYYNVLHAVEILTPGTYYWTHSPLAPGRHRYRLISHSKHGVPYGYAQARYADVPES